MRLPLLLTLLFATAQPASGRQFTLLSYDYLPEVASSKDKAGVGLFSIGLGYPMDLGSVRISQAVRFRGVTVAPRRNWPAQLPDETAYREVRYDLGIRAPLAGRWFASVFAAPTLTSDFAGDVSSLDWGYNLAVLVDRQEALGFGLAYRNRMDPKLVPLLMWKAQLTPRWSADVFLPSFATFWRDSGGEIRYGLEIRYSSLSFHLTEHPLERVDHRMLFAGLTASRPVAKLPLAARITLGAVIANSLEFGEGDNVDKVSNGPGAVFRFALETLN